jgi:hypothetical protein
MEPETLRQLRGGVELAADAVEAAAGAAARLQQTVTRQVYAPFALLGPLAAPALVVEQIQTAITGQVYRAILLTNRLAARGAVALIERQAERPE